MAERQRIRQVETHRAAAVGDSYFAELSRWQVVADGYDRFVLTPTSSRQ